MFKSLKPTEIIAGLVILIVLGMGTYGAMQPNVGLLKFRADGNIAYGHGTTDDRSVPMMRKFFRENPQVNTLVFGKMHGTSDADMNLRIAREIRKRGLKTVLTDKSYIASGAVDLFLAGVERTATCGARIGVHSWSAGRYDYPAKTGRDRRRKVQEDFLSEMGIDTEFYVFTRDQALPHELYFLTPEDIARFDLLTTPLACG